MPIKINEVNQDWLRQTPTVVEGGGRLGEQPSTPLPTPEDKCPPLHCFIAFLDDRENLKLFAGQTQVFEFVYYTGNPPVEDMFLICFYDNPNWEIRRTPPISVHAPFLPTYTFSPERPIQNPVEVEYGSVEFVTPVDIPYDCLYIELLLIEKASIPPPRLPFYVED